MDNFVVRAAAVVILLLTLALPFTTLYAHPGMSLSQAVTATPMMVFTVGIELAVGILILARDRWLGAFVIYTALSAARVPLQGHPFAYSQVVTFGAVVLVLLRRVPRAWHPRIQMALVVSGLVQVGVALAQWGGLEFPPSSGYVTDRQLPGTMGHGNWLGVYLAMVGLLGPVWTLPGFVLGILLAQSRLGLIALGIGLVIKYLPFRHVRPSWLVLAVTCSPALAVGILDKTFTTWSARWEIWRLGVTIWSTNGPLFGLGPGSWALYVPSAQEAFKVGLCPGACFAQAHNDVLQMLFEGGAVALVLLGLWLYEHRQAVHTPQGGALVALAVCSLGMFPFHLAQVALPALVVIAMATAEEP